MSPDMLLCGAGRDRPAGEESECSVAREVTERLIDDLDGGAAVETVTFALDGANYELDLSKKNAGAFRKVLDR